MTSKRERSLNSTSEFRFQKWRLSNNGAFIYTHHRGQICSDKEMFKWPVLKCNRLLSEFTFSLHNDLNSYKASGNMSPSLLRWNNDVGRGGGKEPYIVFSKRKQTLCSWLWHFQLWAILLFEHDSKRWFEMAGPIKSKASMFERLMMNLPAPGWSMRFLHWRCVSILRTRGETKKKTKRVKGYDVTFSMWCVC